MTVSADSLSNFTTHDAVHGWVSASDTRGTFDIAWSCCVTIVLCCWVSTYPNVGSPDDKWYHFLYDKLSLAIISALGPEFILAMAAGQFSKAKEAVRELNKSTNLCKDRKWTLCEGFFLQMGGIHLKSPDFTQGFPINAKQFQYLLTHDFIEFPDIDKMHIDERNSVDTFTRCITILQAAWFTATEIQRLCVGLPITTLELTALSFTFIMFTTSMAWLRKPIIQYPRTIETKNQTTIASIRDFARLHTHPQLQTEWYRTPLDFINGERFRFDVHWSYYIRMAEILHIGPISRPMKAELWNRFPSDGFVDPEVSWAIGTGIIHFAFSLIFLLAWNFHFPSPTERILWRVCSAYHMAFCLYGSVYYSMDWLRLKGIWTKKNSKLDGGAICDSCPRELHLEDQQETNRSRRSCRQLFRRLLAKIQSWRNISENNDPSMALPLRTLVPVTTACFLYVLCRIYIYVEDWISLRSQPAGAYITPDGSLFLVGG